MPQTKSLPVLMYHYISNYENSIAVSPGLFSAHCQKLAEAGWHGVSLAQAEAFFTHGEPLPRRSCLITFDDGYLDNYVYAWPILEKYGHHGVVFAVSQRIENASAAAGPDAAPRATVRELWEKRLPPEALPSVDSPVTVNALGFKERNDLFFTWREARHMEASGVMHVASHSMNHQSVYVDEKFTSFLLPGKRTRTFDRTPQHAWGMPAFTQGAGLANRAFIPSPELVAALHTLVPQDDAQALAFARQSTAQKLLRDCTASLPALGRLETDEEVYQRMYAELADGKTTMEKGLDHPVTSLCWPWGAYNDTARDIGLQLGFTCFFTTQEGANPPGRPLAIRRFKAKANSPEWLLNRVRLYSRPLLGALYGKCRL